MLTKTINHLDLDDNPVQTTVHFHIGKADYIINPNLRKELEQFGLEMQAIAEKLQGAKRELTDEDKQELVDIIVKMMKISYGVRAEDNKGFNKNPELWEQFVHSLAFEAFLIELMTNEATLVSFMLDIMPADVREKAASEMGQSSLFDDSADAPVAPEIAPDYEAMLLEADEPVKNPNAGKNGVTPSQWAFMQNRLNGAQWRDFESKHYIKD